jgi:hypothetical protein
MTSRVLLCLAVALSLPASGQTFDSTSDGSDGALILNRPDPDPNPNQPFVIEFDPDDPRFNQPLDPDRDNVYHFTTITIGPDVIVRLSAQHISGAVYWLAQGEVVIDGTIDLNGEPGHDASSDPNTVYRLAAVAGAGGFGGGIGASANSAPARGLGPGGGRVIDGLAGGAGHTTNGLPYQNPLCGPLTQSGAAYGNPFLVPLQGGSGGGGGGGGTLRIGGGGGAGGGAILIASSASVSIDGTITANGGDGANGGFGGGGGSGGAIRIAAPLVTGTGSLTATGGAGAGGFGAEMELGCGDDGGTGSDGRIRLEAFEQEFTGVTRPTAPRAAPIDVFLPAREDRAQPILRVVSVDGAPLENPTASITSADILAETREPIDVEVQALNIPVGTVVNLRLISENQTDQVIDSPPLMGTRDLSSTTVMIPVLPPGFSRAFVRAEWSEE